MFQNPALVLLLDKETIRDLKLFQNKETQRSLFERKKILINSKEDNYFKNDNSRISVILGIKDHRKAVIQFLLELNPIYLNIIHKISVTKLSQELESVKPSILLDLLDSLERKYFIKLINILKALPYGIIFLGFLIQIESKISDSCFDLIRKLEANFIYDYISAFIEIKETVILVLNDESIKIKITSAFVDEKIDYVCKSGIKERHPLIEVIIKPNINIRRVFYANENEVAFNSNNYFQLMLNAMEGLVESSVVNYDIKYNLLQKQKDNDTIIDKEEFIVKVQSSAISLIKNRLSSNNSKNDKNSKNSILDTKNDIKIQEVNFSNVLEYSNNIITEEIKSLLNKESQSNDNKYTLDYNLENINIDFAFPLEKLEFESIKGKFTSQNTKYLFNIKSKPFLSMFISNDNELKEFEKDVKIRLFNLITDRVFTHLQNKKFDFSKGNILNLELGNFSYISINDYFSIEIDLSDSSFSISDYENVFACFNLESDEILSKSNKFFKLS